MIAKNQENNQFCDPQYQKELWNKQHAYRGERFGREDELKYHPNKSAIEFLRLMPAQANIVEIGSGNGRDARFWASHGHSVVCVDFSEVALQQLTTIAKEQGVMEKITPVLHDVNSGFLPFDTSQNFDGFYARSALHVCNETMIELTKAIDYQLKLGGKVLILGKTLDDIKIRRSKILDIGLAIDHEEDGHIRRIWTSEFMQQMCEVVRWKLLSINYTSEVINNTGSSYITMVAQKI